MLLGYGDEVSQVMLNRTHNKLQRKYKKLQEKYRRLQEYQMTNFLYYSKPRVFVVMGYSGAGKDTLCQQLLRIIDGVNLKWSRPMKDMLEAHYNLPLGFLDDRMKRLEPVPNHPDGISWLDLMIRAFHHLPAIDPLICVRKVKQQAIEALKAGKEVVFTDTRNHTELEVIQEISQDYLVVPVWISRPGVCPKESDCHQLEIYRLLSEKHQGHMVNNNGTIWALEEIAKRIAYDLH